MVMYRGAARSISLAVSSFKTFLLPDTARKGSRTVRLLLFNTTVTATLYTVGDVTQQKIFGADLRYDYARTMRMCALGVCMGPLNHFWYLQLDRFIVGNTLTTVAKKIVCDQLMFAPTCITVFYLGMSLMEGKSWPASKIELQNKFLPSYKADWALWPAAQMINFCFVPGFLRVTYVNLVTVGWTTVLSYLKHREHHNSSLST